MLTNKKETSRVERRKRRKSFQ